MKKLIILIFCFFYSHTFAQTMSDYQYFITPFNISWKSENLPKEILDSSDFIKWKNGLFDDEASLRWSPIHVTSKTLSEIIIQEKSGGTGGLHSILLIKKNGKWKELTSLFGGFIFFNTPSKSNTLIVYERFGADYQNIEFKLINGRYQKMSTREIPLAVSQRNSQDDMFNFFWLMTNGKF